MCGCVQWIWMVLGGWLGGWRMGKLTNDIVMHHYRQMHHPTKMNNWSINVNQLAVVGQPKTGSMSSGIESEWMEIGNGNF